MRRLWTALGVLSTTAVVSAVVTASAVASLPPLTIKGQPADAQSGALLIPPDGNPAGLQPLPPHVPGTALFPIRQDELIPSGLDTSNARNKASLNATPAELAGIVAGANLDLARLQADWWHIEKIQDTYDLEKLDADYLATVEAGVRPVIQLFTSPDWAVSYTDAQAGRLTDHGCDGNFCKQAPSPAHYPRWHRLAGEIARRYPLAAAIEVWNEPNLWGYWHAWNTSPSGYTNLLEEAYEAVKAANPAMRVLGGAINSNDIYRSPPQSCNPAIGPLRYLDCQSKQDLSIATFLEGMLQNGAASKMDGLSYHAKAIANDPSGDDLKYFKLALQRIEEVRSAQGAPDLRLVNSEAGAKVGGSNGFSEAGQAVAVLAEHDLVNDPTSGLPGRDRLDAIIYFESIDVASHGWLRVDRSLRPVYCVMADALGGPPPVC